MPSIIKSSSNEKYKWIKKIISKGPRSGYFVIEGYRATKQAIENGKKPEIIVGSSDEELIEFRVTPELFKKLSAHKSPQGVLSIFKIEGNKFQVADKYLVLDRVSDPGNLGSILRTALAFDYRDVILTKGSVSIYNQKVIRSSLSAVLSMNIKENVEIGDLKELLNGKFSVAASLKDSVNFRSIDYPENVSIIIGNEANGISDEVLDLASRNVIIPMSQSMESLNAAIATAILLEYFYNM